MRNIPPLGIVLSPDGKVLRHNGQRVKLLADKLPDGSFETLWVDDAGTANLSVARNAAGQITAIESLSEKQAQDLRLAADAYEETSLRGLDAKIAQKINALQAKD